MLGFAWPERFSTARTRQETARQNIEKARNDLDVALIDADTRVKQAEIEAQTILNQADAEVEAVSFQASADMRSLQDNLGTEMRAFRELSKTLGYSDKELLKHAFIDTLGSRAEGGEGAAASLLSVKAPRMATRINSACYNGVQDGDETGADTGGACSADF